MDRRLSRDMVRPMKDPWSDGGGSGLTGGEEVGREGQDVGSATVSRQGLGHGSDAERHEDAAVDRTPDEPALGQVSGTGQLSARRFPSLAGVGQGDRFIELGHVARL
jgi:hypothetical protein